MLMQSVVDLLQVSRSFLDCDGGSIRRHMKGSGGGMIGQLLGAHPICVVIILSLRGVRNGH